MHKKYTDEFKQQAVELAQSLGSIMEASRQLGISDSCIHQWKEKLRKENDPAAAVKQLESEELKRLRKENAELKKINHILKSAAAFFSQDHLK